MKAKKATVILSALHFLFWFVRSVLMVIELYTYTATGEALADYLERATITALIYITLAGAISALMLFLSLRTVLLNPDMKQKKASIAALCFSVLSNILFYIFWENLIRTKDGVNGSGISEYLLNIIILVWIICILCQSVLLIVAAVKKRCKLKLE